MKGFATCTGDVMFGDPVYAVNVIIVRVNEYNYIAVNVSRDQRDLLGKRFKSAGFPVNFILYGPSPYKDLINPRN